MTPDVYAAWLTAGDRLQSVVAWLARNSLNLAAAALALIAGWCIWGAFRDASRTIDAALAEINDDREEER